MKFFLIFVKVRSMIMPKSTLNVGTWDILEVWPNSYRYLVFLDWQAAMAIKQGSGTIITCEEMLKCEPKVH